MTHPSYPYVVPTILAVVVAVAAVWLAVKQPKWRILTAAATLALVLFAGYGWAKTCAAHYKWLCVTHHHDMCNHDGDGDPGPTKFGLWMVDHFAD